MSAVVADDRGIPCGRRCFGSRRGVPRWSADIETTRGPIDILVCNAAYMTMAPFVDTDEDDWWKVVDTNLAGTFYTDPGGAAGDAAGPAAATSSSSPPSGASIGWPEATAYSASKAG